VCGGARSEEEGREEGAAQGSGAPQARRAQVSAVEAFDDSNRAEAEAFLARHEDSAQFLINTLREQGSRLTSYPFSGNFKAIRADGRIVGVFYLTRVGNLVGQLQGDYSQLVLEACAAEGIPIKGFIGAWDGIAPIRARFQALHPEFAPGFD